MTLPLHAAMQMVAAAVNEQNRLQALCDSLQIANDRLREELSVAKSTEFDLRDDVRRAERAFEEAKRKASEHEKRADENWENGKQWKALAETEAAKVRRMEALLRENGVAGPWDGDDGGGR